MRTVQMKSQLMERLAGGELEQGWGTHHGGLAEAEAVGAGSEIRFIEGRVAALELLRQVAVEPLGSAGRGRHAVLLALQQAQAVHLLRHPQPGLSRGKGAAM